MLDIILRFEAGLAWCVRAAAIAFLAIVFVFTLGSAADRYIYDAAFNAYEQIAKLALVWFTFLGFVLAYRARTNIRVDLIDGVLSARLRRIRDMAGDLIALGIFGVILWKIWRLIEVGASQVVMGTPFSLDAAYLSLLVAAGFGTLVIIVRFILLIAGRSEPGETDSC